ncbi:MAG: hypothetical protein COV45_04375 [Deltaproteobacteria bacterium CG11_big_fil_rev_8_21_14_0_20_47_16]|nr:MAG: hypothetical protein COV45_04375 [Deltaproteobacteria bacterium CG11_big_fil_rev_8_21_14_0_20_47_16]
MNFIHRPIAVLFGLIIASTALAGPHQGGTAFGVSPPSLKLEVTPGEVATTSLRIENPLKEASTYTLTATGMAIKPSGPTIIPLSSLPADHVARNINFENSTITIPPKSYKNVAITMRLSPNAKGTQFAGIIINRSAGSDDLDTKRTKEFESQAGVGMQPGLNVRVEVSAKGTVNYDVAIKSATSSRASKNQPPVVKMVLTNKGNGSMQINPILVLMDSKGKASIRMRTQNQVTLQPGADSIVEFKAQDQDIPAGTYKALLTISDPQYKMAPMQTSVSIK